MWHGQNPPETDLLARYRNEAFLVYIHIDQPFPGLFRATMGNLFHVMELARTTDLVELLRRCIQFSDTKNEHQIVAIRDRIMKLGGAQPILEKDKSHEQA